MELEKPSLQTAILILVIVIVGIPLVKWAVNRWPIPGLTPLVNAV
jgi:hypothetical protein